MATILVVDDEPLILDILCPRLEKHEYNVLRAGDGAEALKVLGSQENQVDLVITGINMPKMNGFELGEQLRTEYAALPVVYMSAYAIEKAVKCARELRNSRVPEDCAFLTKPFSEEELLRVVRTVLASV